MSAIGRTVTYPLLTEVEGKRRVPDISVIIPVHGDRGLVDLTLDRLDRQNTERSFEVIVADNGDNADLSERLASRKRQVRLVAESRRGSYAARNTAVRLAAAPVLAFTDADCLPRPDWLEQGVRALTDAGSGSWVGGSIFMKPVRSTRLSLAEVWQIGHDLRQDRYVAAGWAATANLFVRTADLLRVGLFDASLQSGGDKEWGLRATACGLRGVYSLEAAIDHPTRPTMAELITKRRRVSQGSVDLAISAGQPVHAEGLRRALRPPLRSTWQQDGSRLADRTDRARLVAITAFLHVYQRGLEGHRFAAATRGPADQAAWPVRATSVGGVDLLRRPLPAATRPPQPAGMPEDMAPEVSIVIPTLNGERTLGAQLRALAAQQTRRTFEVLVADNGSTDGTAAVVAAWADRLPGLRLVDASVRTGSNVARNVGTAAARAETVLLCDSDDEVDPVWVESLATALETVDAVGGTLELNALNPRYAAAPDQPASIPGVVVQLGFLPRPTGANAGFRRSVWEQLGGFDERYVRGGTETEFYWRLQLAGRTFREVPEAVVHYRLRSDVRMSLRQMYTWGHQHPMLYRDFRGHGMPFDPRVSLADAGATLRIASTIPWHRERRMEVAQRLVYRAGRVAGSWHHRVLFP